MRTSLLFALLSQLALFFAFQDSACSIEGERHVLIITGSGGEPRYAEAFLDWANRLESFLVKEGDVPGKNIVVLNEEEGEGEPAVSLNQIEFVLGEFGNRLNEEDELLIFLIGHGSYIAGETRFNIPGEDLTGETLNRLVGEIQCSRMVVVNCTASSAGFINVLSAADRIIVTATKSVNERNATQFAESFLRGLEDGSSDQNRDGRISLLEATRQAAHLTQDWFEDQGFILTEHPLLDDNGDGLGTRLIPEEEGDPMAVELPPGEGVILDGSVAGRYFLKDFSFPPEVPETLAKRYTDLLDEVEEIKSRKSGFDSAEYRSKLEPLLIEAARTHREIRGIIEKLDVEPRSGMPDESER